MSSTTYTTYDLSTTLSQLVNAATVAWCVAASGKIKEVEVENDLKLAKDLLSCYHLNAFACGLNRILAYQKSEFTSDPQVQACFGTYEDAIKFEDDVKYLGRIYDGVTTTELDELTNIHLYQNMKKW